MATGDPFLIGGAARPIGSLAVVVHRGRPLTLLQRGRFFVRRFVPWL